MNVPRKHSWARPAFTLVELLTVVVIIGILVGLITAAAVPAIRKAREATILNEIRQVEMALGEYKEQFGDYPPDFAYVNLAANGAAQNEILRHLTKAFPRYRPGQPRQGTSSPPAASDSQWKRFVDDVAYFCRFSPDGSTVLRLDVNAMDPAAALVFWLGGPPAAGGTTKLAGFSADPANPFWVGELDLNGDGNVDPGQDLNGNSTLDGPGSRLPRLYDFAEGRLQLQHSVYAPALNPLVYKYVPEHVQNPEGGGVPPYVYFRARGERYSDDGAVYTSPGYIHTSCGACYPYAREQQTGRPPVWLNPRKFQILCSGLDGVYGLPNNPEDQPFPSTPTAIRLAGKPEDITDSSEDDNLTNFATGRIGDGVQ
ncbi:MAG: type II secretion system protein [Pirellulales bacterium]|nr:type II secretion system protein [Pirellulales bacterium]